MPYLVFMQSFCVFFWTSPLIFLSNIFKESRDRGKKKEKEKFLFSAPGVFWFYPYKPSPGRFFCSSDS